MKPDTPSLSSVKQQLRALKNRVSYLEQALKRAKRKREDLAPIADHRNRAEREARSAALKDYYERERLARLRRSPWLLEVDQRLEDERNDFLKSRGLAPDPTEIPKELRKQARALVADKRLTT